MSLLLLASAALAGAEVVTTGCDEAEQFRQMLQVGEEQIDRTLDRIERVHQMTNNLYRAGSDTGDGNGLGLGGNNSNGDHIYGRDIDRGASKN